MDLFEHSAAKDPSLTPLAERMRPRSLTEMIGQSKILRDNSLLARALADKKVPSLILWGPPGTGKTTLANVIAHETGQTLMTLSAVMSGVADLRETLKKAENIRNVQRRRAIVFIDEIHRFNRAQQDALLPHVERGAVTLIGATTENPSFAVNGALLSRARVVRLEPLSDDELVKLLSRALTDGARGLGMSHLSASAETLGAIAEAATGDARQALTTLELAAQWCLTAKASAISIEAVQSAIANKRPLHDKSGDNHYDVVSAFIKSMRGSDPDASVYWMMRMVEGGEEPLFITRRMLIFASEDIGIADPQALLIAAATDQALQRLGLPEALHNLAHCCIYLANAPKSNACYSAWSRAKKDIERFGALPVPIKLRNAPTAAMKEEGFGKGYRYPHNEGGIAKGETYLPEKLLGRKYIESPIKPSVEQENAIDPMHITKGSNA